MKKRKGPYADGLLSLVCIFAIIILVQSFLFLLEALERKEDIRQYARSSILEMENTGYLSPEKKAVLIQKLTELQVTDVDFSGTTFVNVGYGNDVYLCIKGKIPLKTLNTSSNDMFTFLFNNVQIELSINMMSTAKN